LQHKWIKTLTNKKQDTKLLAKLNISTMKQFQHSQKLKQVALMAIAVQSDPKELQELKDIFQELDKNGDGSISFEELQAGLGNRENGEELLSILKAADTDGNGTINYTGKCFL
jgi:calcium-dependent protein kinase